MLNCKKRPIKWTCSLFVSCKCLCNIVEVTEYMASFGDAMVNTIFSSWFLCSAFQKPLIFKKGYPGTTCRDAALHTLFVGYCTLSWRYGEAGCFKYILCGEPEQ